MGQRHGQRRSARQVCRAGLLAHYCPRHSRRWVCAGQALQRTLLTAAISGVAAALHSQPLELARTRDHIRASMCDGTFPQMIIRLGTIIQNAASVRRPALAVLRPGESHRSPAAK